VRASVTRADAPAGVFNGVIGLKRRVSHEGLRIQPVDGNYYSLPDRTRRRTVDVHRLAHEIRIYEDGELLAAHPVPEGRQRTSLLPGHRHPSQRRQMTEHNLPSVTSSVVLRPGGEALSQCREVRMAATDLCHLADTALPCEPAHATGARSS
jgi:hypothetical protein